MDDEKLTPADLWWLLEKASRNWLPFSCHRLWPHSLLYPLGSTVAIKPDPQNPLRGMATIELVWPLEIIKRDFLRELKQLRPNRDRIRPDINHNPVFFAVWLVKEKSMSAGDVGLAMFGNRTRRSLIQHWVNRIDRALRTTRLPKLKFLYNRWLRECPNRYEKDFDAIVERIKSRA